MNVVENAHIEIRTRKHMTKIHLTDNDIKTINAMIDILKELDSADPADFVRDHIEEYDCAVPNICYSEFVDWLKACKGTLSPGVVWDEETGEVLTIIPGDIVELSY